MTYDARLPESSELNIINLSRIFDNTTNSYKYIFFLSILDILKRRNFDVTTPVTFRELTIEMLANTWFPHTYFRLSFGIQDQITKKLDSLNLEITDAVLKFTDTDKQQLRKTIGEQKIDNSLMKYVPFRLIMPFLEIETKPTKDGGVNPWAVKQSAVAYEVGDTPYLINDHKNFIKLHPLWADYLQKHYAIIRGWAAWEWLQYMQKCNSNVLNLSEKLFPPQERSTLTELKKYWKVVIENSPLYCIFSGQQITEVSAPLDHYLPWSFVAHNQLWNLIPTLQRVNSSKSNSLPDASYHQDFIALQHHGLTVTHQHLTESLWNKYTESYVLDLKITRREDLLNKEILSKAYQPILESLTSLAKGQGFAVGWKYTQLR